MRSIVSFADIQFGLANFLFGVLVFFVLVAMSSTHNWAENTQILAFFENVWPFLRLKALNMTPCLSKFGGFSRIRPWRLRLRLRGSFGWMLSWICCKKRSEPIFLRSFWGIVSAVRSDLLSFLAAKKKYNWPRNEIIFPCKSFQRSLSFSTACIFVELSKFFWAAKVKFGWRSNPILHYFSAKESWMLKNSEAELKILNWAFKRYFNHIIL